jgi:predicted nucleic acid-binding protein
MSLVVDASVMASWYFPDERNPTAEAVRAVLMSKEDVVLVPGIWWFEVGNFLVVGERRTRTTSENASRFVAFVAKLPITIAPNPEFKLILALARRHRLSFYDAAYLELAQRENIPLATLDQALARAAIAESVPLIGA